MPPRVNKKLLLVIVGLVVLVVVSGATWVILRGRTEVRRKQVVEEANEYHLAGETQKERFGLERWLVREPRDVELRLRLARLLEQEGQVPQAYNEYRNVVRYDPLNVEALLKVAHYEGGNRRWGEMRRVAKVVVDLLPANAEARLYMAQACLGLGPDYQLEALENARTAVKNDPKNIEAYLTLARVHQQRKAADEVRQVLDEALKVDPTSQELWSFLGIYHLSLGEKKEAEAAFKAALENAKDKARANLELAIFYDREQKWDEAESCFKAAVDNATSQMEKLTSYTALGDFYAHRNNLDEALKQYDEALVVFPKHPDVLVKKAQVYLSQRKYDEARKAIEDVKARAGRDPYTVQALYLNGYRLLLEDQPQEAISELEKALSTAQLANLRINTSEMLLALAQGYLKLSDTDKARKALQDAYAQDPESPRILIALSRLLLALREYDQAISILNVPRKPYAGYLLLAQAYMARGAKGYEKDALTQLNTALKANPDDGQVHVELGRLAVQTRNFAGSIKHFDEAIRLRPKDRIAYLSKAVAYELDKKTREAEQTYREAMKAMPRDVQLRYEFARFLSRQGRLADGEALLLEEMKQHPEDENWARGIEELLPRYYMSAGKVDKAVECYRAQAEKDPKDVKVRQTLVLLAMTRQQKDEVEKYIEEIKKVEPSDSPMVLRLEGQQLVMERNYKDALTKLLDAEKSSPSDLDVSYYIGLCYLRTGQADKARPYIEKVSARFPANPRVQRALAEIYYTLGMLDEARKLAEDLRARGESSMALDLIIADAETKGGELEEGEAAWREFTKKSPDRPEGWLGLADALLRQGQRTEAIPALEKAYELDDKSFRTTWSLANLHLLEKEYDKAIAVTQGSLEKNKDNLALLGLLARLYEVSDKPREARDVYEKIRRLDPSNPLPAIAEADRAMAANDFAQAEVGYREALRLRPEDRVLRTRVIDILMRQNKAADALALVDSVLREKPDDVGMTVLKARLCVAQNQPEEAIRLFKRALQLSRDAGVEKQNFLIHYELAQLYMALGRVSEAQLSFEATREINPDFTEARLALVQINLQLGRTAQARAECLRILETKPDLTAYITLGDIARAENRLQEARGYYDKADSEFPDTTLPLRRTAALLMQEKKPDEAVAVLRRVLDRENQHAQALAMLVDVLVSQKRFDDAISTCRMSLEKSHDDANAYLFMGNVEAARGNYTQARKHYDTSLDKQGDNPGVYLAKAQTYLEEKNEVKAVDEARQALKVNAAYEPAYMFLERIYRTDQKRDELDGLYREWGKGIPTSVVAVNNQAWFLGEVMNRPDDALRVIDAFRARQTPGGREFPHAAELDDTEGRAYFQKGDCKRAVDLFKRSLDKRTDSAMTWEHLRLAYAKLVEQASEQGDTSAAQRYEIEARTAFAKVRELSPGNSEMQVQLGDMKLGEGKLEEAIQAYQQALETRKDPEVQRKLAELLIRDNRIEQATKHITELVNSDPKEPMNLILEAMLLSRTGKSDEAVKLLEKVIQEHPDIFTAHYVLAGEYIGQNQIEKGRVELDKTIELAPKFSGAKLVKARLLAAQGKLDDALSECKAVTGLEPMNFEAWFNIGNFQLGQNKIAEAEKTFRTMREKWPDSLLARERLAETYRRANRLGEALLEYQDARRQAPRSLMILRGLVFVLQAQGKGDQAIREYEGYTEDNPESTDAWIDLASVYAREQRWAYAERAFKSAIRTARTNPDVHSALTDFYLGRSMFPETREAAQRLMEDVPTSIGKSLGRSIIARSYEMENKIDEAIKEYREALSGDAKNPAAANNLAWLLATRKNDPDGAIKVAEPYLQGNPGFAELFDTVGWAYRLKGDTKTAEPLVGRAVQLQIARQQVQPSILYHYGDILFRNGKETDAKKFLELATKVKFPEYNDAIEILNKIK